MKWVDGVVITMTLTAFLLGGVIYFQYKASLIQEGKEYDFRTNVNTKIDAVDHDKSFEHKVKPTF